MYSLERWTRTFFVCLCLWLGSRFSIQQQGAADSNEWAHGVDSAIAASGGFSSLAMRGCVSTKPTRNSEQWACSRRPCTDCWSRPEGVLCALMFELSGRQRQDARPGLAEMYRVSPDRA